VEQEREEHHKQDDREVRRADHVHSADLHPVVLYETENGHGLNHP
jgi:hypothetical protein